ncbi:hypothetical protein C8P67_104380 [Flavobacterium aquicola]|uniref:Uncharacterized protein n=1 Tax=Flavobacterium aquicola TaxID=1682742 RepID=A0A3E0ENT4_9FLAO|nr:hypothetical protein C8P67_104380 [Flavobacterium aquicola]
MIISQPEEYGIIRTELLFFWNKMVAYATSKLSNVPLFVTFFVDACLKLSL